MVELQQSPSRPSPTPSAGGARRQSRGRLLPALLLLAAPAPLPAQAELSIAVINPTRIVEESPQYEAARTLLAAEVKEREASLRAQQEEIDQLNARLERDGALMSAEEAARLRSDIRTRERRLNYARSEVQEEFALRQSDLRTKLVRQVEEVVQRIAREKGIDLILSEGVVFYSERVDISAEVIDRLKAEFKRP